jgi:hypothetical protein
VQTQVNPPSDRNNSPINRLGREHHQDNPLRLLDRFRGSVIAGEKLFVEAHNDIESRHLHEACYIAAF